MPNVYRDYFDKKMPVRPGDPTFVGPPAPTWQNGWNNLSKQLFVVMPNQLDRCKHFRNRFLKAVQ